ncbi:hypothetical protein IEQ34_008330 [Dendrobium chrysotoxum]|uniref:Uncharacterized protein n=1 Tax=Dendrobium chrysotoxum TaxID=161865 RepID=A0AAV7GG33_DENCH|nr:hypothetical protein IEQ34_008330 [Dendrobium chrysotoxum]
MRISPLEPFVFAVDLTSTSLPSTETAKSIMSSAEVAHRFVSPRLGERSQSATVEATAFSMVVPGGNLKISATAEADNGMFTAIDRGRNERGGFRS